MDDRLKEAFYKSMRRGKSSLRLRLFGKKVKRKVFLNRPTLHVIAFSEEIHGERALRMLRKSMTPRQIQGEFASETRVAEVAYDHFLKLAGEIGDPAARIFLPLQRCRRSRIFIRRR